MRRVKTANKVGIDAADKRAAAAIRLNERYRLVRRIGEGASSEVFLADDLVAGQPCAAKVYGQGGEAESRRLLAEFARLTELHHRNVVRVRDLGRARQGELAGRPFLITDYVAGRPLTSL